ncbi:MAG: DUF364 domain-containing protein [Syntrophales bacterium]|jgi:hypothetical protein|nr:DUF364 domain-containing protein [Syntrophales bacterium]MDD4339704.1 DUF364 domain-containing protein [Syntrophales bacterium]HOG08628.1 DUF364 domain-containing protein [Syntrophales bacterium]HQP29449.1 DUF364 domain-containing protein [Syntrophales bacterium]
MSHTEKTAMGKTERKGALAARLSGLLRERAARRTVVEVCIGSTYLAVCLDDGALGLSAVPRAEVPLKIETLPPPPSLAGENASAVLAWLNEPGRPRRKAVALALANALIRQDRSDAEGDALDLIRLTPDDRVVMVGRFSPLIEKVQVTGAALTILEKDADKGLVLAGRERGAVLRSATVALITATTLLYDSLEEILDDLGGARHVTVLGPTTPMLAGLFSGTPVHHLGGVRVTDAGRILAIVAAGGGTRAMRPGVEMTNLWIRRPL